MSRTMIHPTRWLSKYGSAGVVFSGTGHEPPDGIPSFASSTRMQPAPAAVPGTRRLWSRGFVVSAWFGVAFEQAKA